MAPAEFPIVVAGTGPAGLAAAAAIVQAGWEVLLAGPPPVRDDQRTTALMLPSIDMLEEIGIVEQLRSSAAPLKAIRIIDATTRLLRSPTVTFNASEIGEEYFGLNIPNDTLIAALDSTAGALRCITRWEAPVEEWILSPDRVVGRLSDGRSFAARLVVAADGRKSPARQVAGIRTWTRHLPQSALVLSFAHERDHGFTSNEFHAEDGPFTQVPLPGRRSSLVWVTSPREAGAMRDLPSDRLAIEIEARLHSILGKVEVEGLRQLYPLSATLSFGVARNRVALVGEAAHVFPPIGAQGLNLGLRDIWELKRLLAAERQDPGRPGLLAAYERRRRPDILMRAFGVNLLNLSLLSNMLPAQLARSAGLGLLQGMPPLRALAMREGMQPGSGLGALIGGLLPRPFRERDRGADNRS